MELMLFFFFFCLRHGRQRDWCGASAVSQRVSVRKRLRGEDHLFASCPCKAVSILYPGMFSLYQMGQSHGARAARASHRREPFARGHTTWATARPPSIACMAAG